MTSPDKPIAKGRGSQASPQNRFQPISLEHDLEYLDNDPDAIEQLESLKTEYLIDDSKSIVSPNSSPDIPFKYSLNPYRGCAHGCAYCYARPTHEYLGLNAGLDFESRIFVKTRAPELLRDWLCKPKWKCERIVISGVTDCYQPCERRFKLTRGCIEVAREARQPISIITKNAMVVRDLDLLQPMAKDRLTHVAISMTSLDQSLTRSLEPRTSSPKAKLEAIKELSAAGIHVQLMASPIIPGLNDHEIPSILEAAADHGAKSASYILLRLPLNVEPVFLEWLNRARPDQAEKVVNRIKLTRDGKLSDSSFGTRMSGTGLIADQISNTFRVFATKFGLKAESEKLRTDLFFPPQKSNRQLRLF